LTNPEKEGVPARSLKATAKQRISDPSTGTSPGSNPSHTGDRLQASFQALIESTSDLIWSVDLDFRLVAFNRAFQKALETAFGIRVEPGMSREGLLPPEKAAMFPPLYERALRDGPVRAEYSMIDGRTLELTFNPILANHKPIGVSVFGKDITEGKMAERALRLSEESLRESQRIAGLGSYVLDVASGVWTSSKILDEIFGIGEDYGRTVEGWTALVHPDDRATMAAYFEEEVVGAGRTFDKEYRIVRQTDQAVRWVHGMGRLEFDARGLPSKMMGTIQDLTERKLAEQALRDSEERYRVTFEQAGVGIVHASFDGRYLRCNSRFAEIIGYSREEIPGMSFLQTTLSGDQAESESIFQQFACGATDGSIYEKRYRRKDGSLVWMKLTVSLQRDSEGRPLHLIAMVEDIDARKQAEASLQEATERLTLAVRAGGGGIFDYDIVNDSLIWDEQQFRLYGIPPDRFGGAFETWRNGLHPDDLQRAEEEFNAALRGEKEFNTEFRVVWPDGSIHHLRALALVKRDAAGNALRMVGTNWEITDQKHAEARLRDSEERYRLAFQMNLDSMDICHLDDGKFVDVNDAFLRNTGFAREEVIGRSALELGIWADPGDRQNLLEMLHADSACRNLEARYRTRDGTLRWGLLSVSAIELDGVPCILSVTHDITEAKAAAERLAAAQQALKTSEERYRTAFQTSLDGFCISRLSDGEYIDVNRAFLEIVGFEREEVIGRTSLELNLWIDWDLRQRLVERLTKESSFQNVTTQYRKKDGQAIWIQLSSSLIEIEGASRVLTVVRDMSEAMAAEERLAAAQRALRTSEARYRTAFQTSLDAVSINHLDDGRYIDANQAYLDALGFGPSELLGKTSLELGIWANPGDRALLVEALRQNGSCRDLEAQFRRKNGEIFWCLMSASVMELDGVPCILSFSRDLSTVKAAQEQVRSLAYYDPLTQLPNRRLLMDRLRQTVAAGSRNHRKKALLCLDLDDFKTINDTLGHQTGDLLLQQVAQRILDCIGDADTVARLGGDEFVVILEHLSENPIEAAALAEAAANKILAAVDRPYSLNGHECRSTSSIGIAIFGDGLHDADEVLQQADIAMYQAKTAGRNTLRFFAPALQSAVKARAALEEGLRQGIKACEFLLFYQPQIDSCRLVGVEALLRWNHPARGLLAPAEFISLAEETGLILPLGDRVLETACAQIAAWARKKEASGLSIAVNISARQFRQSGFVDQVVSTLDRTGADPHRLMLELTESVLLDDVEKAISTMTTLKAHGLQFSLDDFGTGYSSLSYLKRLPLDQLKLDRSFVRDILVDLSSGAIAQTVISLGRAMGLSVMAEGVETEAQRDLLAELGCQAFQGYLFSRPLPVEEFQRTWLVSSKEEVSSMK
jgi:diguanylate cyclase (GGDEF)-like protein/PAS domain S-box-containing protein